MQHGGGMDEGFVGLVSTTVEKDTSSCELLSLDGIVKCDISCSS